MKKLLPFLGVLLFVGVVLAFPSAFYNFYTTNNTATVNTGVTNIATGTIALDATKQATNALLTGYVNSLKFTGIVTNGNSVGTTNFMEFSAGILTNVVIGAHP